VPVRPGEPGILGYCTSKVIAEALLTDKQKNPIDKKNRKQIQALKTFWYFIIISILSYLTSFVIKFKGGLSQIF
jgi:hypothetical protein